MLSKMTWAHGRRGEVYLPLVQGNIGDYRIEMGTLGRVYDI